MTPGQYDDLDEGAENFYLILLGETPVINTTEVFVYCCSRYYCFVTLHSGHGEKRAHVCERNEGRGSSFCRTGPPPTSRVPGGNVTATSCRSRRYSLSTRRTTSIGRSTERTQVWSTSLNMPYTPLATGLILTVSRPFLWNSPYLHLRLVSHVC